MSQPKPTARKAPPPFFSDDPASDATYVAVRDEPHLIHHRQRAEDLWERFRDYCGDRHAFFLAQARENFRQRSWEMYLASLFLEQRQSLQKPTGEQPDIKLAVGATTVWIEAVAVERGVGPNAVDEPVLLQPIFDLRHESMILRYTNAIGIKLDQCRVRKAKGRVGAADIYIIAVNASSLPFGNVELECPDIARALFAIGPPRYVAPIGESTGPSRVELRHRPAIRKNAGQEVATTYFMDDQAADISAVLFVATHPLRADLNGDDVVLLHNPHARVPLPHGTFQFGHEWWTDKERRNLHCYSWRLTAEMPPQRRIDEFEAEMEKLNDR